MNFWSVDTEIHFFELTLKNFASPEQLFYKLKEGYFAYIPKGKRAKNQALQSRNALIGQFTEKWSKDFFSKIAEELNLYPVNDVVCPELGLTKQSGADLAFCETNGRFQKPENIKLIFEIKMSIVNNYKLENNQVKFFGDFKTHKGNPSLLRSDSMLKAIGKAINIRVSGSKASQIPIIVLGNSPIGKSYIEKVDYLKKSGIVQGFLSVYPNVPDDSLKETELGGFQTFNDYQKLKNFIFNLVETDMNFFSSMIPKEKLGQIIEISSKELSEISKAEKFLQLIHNIK